MLDDVLRQIRGVRADPDQQGRSPRPLPASADEVQVRDGRDAALVNETPALASLVVDLEISEIVGQLNWIVSSYLPLAVFG